MVYQFAKGARLAGDPQLVGEALESIRAKRKSLTPKAVVQEAKRQAHPLHLYFEWDDAAAGAAYRETQAAYLIRSVTVKVEELPQQPVIRAFVSAGDRSHEYEPIHAVLCDTDRRGQLLAQALRELEALRQKYSTLLEAAQAIQGAIDALRKEAKAA
jgi:hypothetical protein